MTSIRSTLIILVLASCADRPVLENTNPSLETLGRKLPRGFVLGAASSSHQIEGGNSNDWTDWEMGSFPDGTPHIVNGDQSGLATDGWNRFDQDLAALKTLGVDSYRFSVEWSRLEPSPGEWNEAAFDRYGAQLAALREAGIEPMVTIHHFTLPKWVAAKGGFENDETQTDLARLSTELARRFGGLVDFWCPINEINVYAAQGYLSGIWPPGVKDDTARQAKVTASMLKAHAKMARALRENDVFDANGDGRATIITTAHHVRIFQPASSAPLDTAIAGLTDDFANESIPRALKTGRIQLSVPGTIELDEYVEDLAGSIDVLGINYYTRDMVRADLGSASLSQLYYRPHRPVNDLQWDVYPDGLYFALKRFASYGWPQYVTENGMPDDADEHRSLFLAQHLAAVERAVGEGVDVRGYYYWSLTDNFEWAEGFEPRFGMFRVNYETFERTPTQAVEVFRKVQANIRD